MNLSRIINKEDRRRDKYLSRIFGIFSEEIASLWFQSGHSKYENYGRPTVYERGLETRGWTMDFTLHDKDEGSVCISEMKCELEYNNYSYLELKGYDQLKHHTGPAFQRFLAVAHDPERYYVTVRGKQIPVSGSILIWGGSRKKEKRR